MSIQRAKSTLPSPKLSKLIHRFLNYELPLGQTSKNFQHNTAGKVILTTSELLGDN